MRVKNQAYLPEDSIHPFAGVDYQDPSTLVDPHYSPEVQNVNVDKGHLSKRFGYVALGGAVDGTPLAITEFEALDGTVYLLLFTTTKEYKWSGSAWTDITFTTTAPLLVNRTGTEEDGLDFVIVSGYDSTDTFRKWIIITNGVDKPRYWDGTLATFYEYSTATVANHGAALEYTNFVTSKTITVLDSYVILANVTTTVSEPSTVAWSDTGSLTNFGTNATLGQGSAGAIPLTDATGPLKKVMVLGDRVMIYAEDTVHAMVHTGGNDIFSFTRILSDTRLASSRAIIDISGAHLFLGQENVYLFDGSRSLLPLADVISLRAREELQPDLRSLAWAFLDKAKNTVYWCIPTSSTTNVIYKLEYSASDIRQVRWTKHVYSKRLTTMGFWRRVATLAWNDASLTSKPWSTMAMNWTQGSLKGGFPQRVIGYPLGVMLADDTLWTDNAEAVESFWDSIDLVAPQGQYLSENARWGKIELELKGQSCDVSYSTDRGVTFTLLQTLTLTSDWTKYKVDIDVTAKTLRIRISNNTSNGFELRFLRAMVKAVGL